MGARAATIERDGVKLYGLQTEIDRIQRDVNALGAVNLAALEELTAARERKGFLDAQNADLQEAMQTLEEAIRKIDAETRDLLRSTFERVDAGFGQMFPSLFGRGTARLVLTGDVELGLTARNMLDRLPWETVPLGLRIAFNRRARSARAARDAHRTRKA